MLAHGAKYQKRAHFTNNTLFIIYITLSVCNFAPFLTIFDKSYMSLQKFELFYFSTFSKNSFARTFSRMP